MTFEELQLAVTAGSIDTVLVCMVDMQGRLMGKRCHAEFFIQHGYQETHACNYLLADDLEMLPVPGYSSASWKRGYGDLLLKPDLSTLRPLPWLDATALVICDIFDAAGQPTAHSPRQILQKQLRRLADLGMCAGFASELEFYVFDEPYDAITKKNYNNLETFGTYNQDYHILSTTRQESVMRPIRNGLYGAGVSVECTKGEGGAGQGEINVRYADPLLMADHHVLIKHGSKEIAAQHGKAITYMAKWNNELAGSSCHIHSSLWSLDGKPLFYDASAPSGMSALMKSYLGGLLKYSKDITLLLAPYINSYKRFQMDTFAPTKVAWSHDNRTVGFRVCGEGSSAVRAECRIGGADLNPYLAFSGLIAAGLSGIEENLNLPSPFVGNGYRDAQLPEIPKTLRAATEVASKSAWLREVLGNEVVDHYVHAAQWEQAEHDRCITDWELSRGFERS
ncbi:glutamine synthetase family protein [Pseudomonas syringae]|uniref:Glutamine synthetase, catalytic domain protein n=4 Tax=Pseudomonas syringae TaxID=317 RepID=A0A656JRY4_PSESF|nr:glutamine synthetase family protein [Pseudomonas syringae]EPN48941.1 glutamine synthetase, catalytic domain protein [Pseudomonas syringae pv. actinidiae ICMP 19096]EPM48271.1 glutamine synthetase, catalytic domain protein [Pseudomonas syringae pv. actinidiae ICMP 19098]EPN00312.1 glutamine synthetase, catalytic domain protein [Pseudomonas syringae pv. actinidiae ICMP 18804]EPN18956.1 glutamine synthetase, catalytic domain protein [Pseudomonas syringae pv. actinidiae ICMP 19100]EPN26363.1 gl